MVNDREHINIFDGFIFTKVFQAFRMAIQPTKFIITFTALAFICLAGWLLDLSKTVDINDAHNTELQAYFSNPNQSEKLSNLMLFTNEQQGVFSTIWRLSAKKFKGAVDSLFNFELPDVITNITNFFKGIGWALKYHTIYCLIFFAIALCVFSIAGGAICRISSLQIARGEKPGLTEALTFSRKRLVHFLTAPLAPIIIIAFIAALIIILALLGNIPRVGEIIVAFGAPLALISGALITVVIIGTVAGWNLMYPAIAYDGSDCFDSISRSFSYIFARPWHMLFYTSIAAIYGSICYTFVRFFAYLTLLITRWITDLGLWTNSVSGISEKIDAFWPETSFVDLIIDMPELSQNWSENIASFVIYLCLLVVVGLVVSFIINFYLSANTIIYSLLRNKVDNTAFDDIYSPDEEDIEPDLTGIETEGQTEPEPEAKPEPEPESSEESEPEEPPKTENTKD